LKMEASYLSETLLSIDRAIGVSNQKTIVWEFENYIFNQFKTLRL
jgi:hypothetical protein